MFECCEELLLLRPSLRMEPNRDRPGAGVWRVGGEWTFHGLPEGMIKCEWYDIEDERISNA
jgi:hypothetical protein